MDFDIVDNLTIYQRFEELQGKKVNVLIIIYHQFDNIFFSSGTQMSR